MSPCSTRMKRTCINNSIVGARSTTSPPRFTGRSRSFAASLAKQRLTSPYVKSIWRSQRLSWSNQECSPVIMWCSMWLPTCRAMMKNSKFWGEMRTFTHFVKYCWTCFHTLWYLRSPRSRKPKHRRKRWTIANISTIGFSRVFRAQKCSNHADTSSNLYLSLTKNTSNLNKKHSKSASFLSWSKMWWL